MSTEEDNAVMGGQTPEQAAEGAEDSQEAVPAAKEPIRMAGQEFASVEEASQHMAELERQRVAAESYARGVKDVATQPDQGAGVGESEEEILKTIEDKFFNDPAKSMRDSAAQTKAEVKDEIRAELAAERSRDQIWSRFYKKHPDMENKQTIVSALAAQMATDPTYSGLDMDQGLEKVAAEIRKTFVPERVLPSGGVQVAGASGAAVAAPVSDAPQKDLDFITQIRQLRVKK